MGKPGMSLPPHALAHPRLPADHLSGVKQMPVGPRGSPMYPPQQQQLPEMYYPDTRAPPSASQYEPSQYPTGSTSRTLVLLNKPVILALAYLSCCLSWG